MDSITWTRQLSNDGPRSWKITLGLIGLDCQGYDRKPPLFNVHFDDTAFLLSPTPPASKDTIKAGVLWALLHLHRTLPFGNDTQLAQVASCTLPRPEDLLRGKLALMAAITLKMLTSQSLRVMHSLIPLTLLHRRHRMLRRHHILRILLRHLSQQPKQRLQPGQNKLGPQKSVDMLAARSMKKI
jgi:hypothetical protein